MKFKSIGFLSFLLVTAFSGALAETSKNLTLTEIEPKVESLLSKMTLEEKIGQLNQYSPYDEVKKKIQKQTADGQMGSLLNVFGAKEVNEYQKPAVENSRLHIPLLFGLDIIHGYKTTFPIPLAEDCAWNPDLLRQCAAVGAKEGSAAGIRWTFAPMVDVSREPRWGRIAEGSGEDPTLGSIMAVARVKGFQGEHLDDEGSIAACAKHFVGYGQPEAGRDYNTTDMSEVTLREVYLPPFKAALDAGVCTFMSSFNDLNGVPASGTVHTLKDILRDEWGFQGFVVSDWASLDQMRDHGYAADGKDAALKGFQARVDMDMFDEVYKDHLAQLLKEKKVTLAMIDDSVRRILKVKFELGLFEHPYTDEKAEAAAMLTPENLQLALEEGRQSIVLLKNEKNLLPLSKDLKTIAVIGTLADSPLDCLGPWHCRGDLVLDQVVPILKGLKKKLGDQTKILYSPGVSPKDNKAPQSQIDEAVKTVQGAQVAIVVVGETQDMSGEAAARAYLGLPGRQEEMVEAIQATGVPVVLVLMNGRPLTLPWAADHVPAIVESWFLGTRHGDAVADVLFGDTNPSGKLVVTFPRSVGQVPIYYAHMRTGRPATEDSWTSKYLDSPNSPQYPFGFGLSYTQYAYSDLGLSAKSLPAKGSLRVTATVKNTGSREGTEIVQLYIQDLVADVTQPVKKLMDFKRVTLKPGESQKVEFTLPAGKLGYYTQQGKYVVQTGKFNVWVGKASDDETLKGSFDLVGQVEAKKD